MKKMNVLVTGCGGDIGFGIGKILKQENIANLLIGCDIHHDHPGNILFDKCILVKRVDDSQYIKSIGSIIKKHKIDIIIPTSEPELRFFAENNLTSILDIPLIIANQKSMEIGFDKFRTAQFLKENNLPSPWTSYVKDGAPKELPCIIKDPIGCGSKNIHIVDEMNIGFYSKVQSEGIFQELLLPNDQEYTCGIYGTKLGEIRTIIFKRTLHGDNTGKGELVKNAQINDLLTKIAEKIDLTGSINVQLRLTQRGAIVFEINPRFSSTVIFRHKIGFCDVIWSINETLYNKIDKYQEPRLPIKFYRIPDEVIIYE